MGSHFGVDEHPFETYFDVHQGYRVLTHNHILVCVFFFEGALFGVVFEGNKRTNHRSFLVHI